MTKTGDRPTKRTRQSKAGAADVAPAAPSSIDPVGDKLKELNVTDDVAQKIKDVLGATKVEDLSGMTEKDLVECGMKVLPARNLIKALVPVPEAAPQGLAVPRATATSTLRLQEPPTAATSWLSSLCAIRPQIIQPLTVITGIKASMADVYGYFQLPRKMMRMLREAADKVGEGVPDLYFELQNLTQARRYGALVAWMQGKASACTVRERNRFLQRMHERFWDALEAFYNELDAWRKGRRDSMDIGEQMAAAMSGEMQIFDATQVRTAGLALGDSINRVFSGTGVYAATALALDNERLQEVLTQLDFRLFGVQSREQLLAELGCAVPAEIVSAENTIAKFAWNAMSLKDMAAGGMDEQKFLIELASIGTSRQWSMIKTLAAKRENLRPTDIGEMIEEEDEPGTGKLTGIGGPGNRL